MASKGHFYFSINSLSVDLANRISLTYYIFLECLRKSKKKSGIL
jgi:hypothetical protein